MTSNPVHEIKDRRESLELSQVELSRKANLQDNYVCRLEGGVFHNPSFPKVTAILSALDREELAHQNSRRDECPEQPGAVK